MITQKNQFIEIIFKLKQAMFWSYQNACRDTRTRYAALRLAWGKTISRYIVSRYDIDFIPV